MVVIEVGQGVVGAVERGGKLVFWVDGRFLEGGFRPLLPAWSVAGGGIVDLGGGSCADGLGLRPCPFSFWRNFFFWGCAWGRLLSVEYLRT